MTDEHDEIEMSEEEYKEYIDSLIEGPGYLTYQSARAVGMSHEDAVIHMLERLLARQQNRKAKG